ncbi:Bax inhibitor-1/YccA family membrane protein [Candidatus Phytoplasma oryzae]|nr:Bax inhibitor-1/YccA family protein [Candidatus Phytoplasma oryzae]
MNRNFLKKVFKKNNYIIEDMKLKSQEIYSNYSSTKKKSCSLNSIALKTLFLFCCTALGILISDILLFRYMKMNINKSNSYSFISILLISCSLIQCFLFILSNKISLNYQKIIATIIAFVEGITLSCFFNLLKMYYSNLIYGIILAFFSTIALFLIVQFLYINNIITVNNKFKVFAIVSCLILILTQFIINIFLYFTHFQISRTNNLFFLIVSLCFLIMGCMNLAIDFDDANFIVSHQLHKDNEWRIALGFHMNLIFIFIRCILILIELGFLKKDSN